MSAPTFDDRFIRSLPGDPIRENLRRQVPRACWSRVDATPVPAPQMMLWVPEVAELLGLSAAQMDSREMLAALAGNGTLDGMAPYASCYGGHQFGNWAGQLGDGRAITLGELVRDDGARFELQLKGAGPTPYSRSGDGRAVMRSSVRELLCSEAMHHLGVPTTRALSLVATGESVMRDVMYDGHPAPEPGAIVCRVAPSFLRFGNFEILAARNDIEVLRKLVDYTITHHFAELGAPSLEVYEAWVAEVCRRTAEMVVHWMRVGFVHGVMNTDNMSIHGLTIDYGPYGWLEGYDPDWTPNTTDAGRRRYRYGHQPSVAAWNLVRFAEAIVPLFAEAGLDAPAAPMERALAVYGETLRRSEGVMLAAKLGLDALDDDPASEDVQLVEEAFAVLRAVETDMTLFYRGLADVPTAEDASAETRLAPLTGAYYREPTESERERTVAWLTRYAARARASGVSDADRRARMNAVNPKYVPRNYLAQLAIDGADSGDATKLSALLDVLRHPYDEQPEREAEFAGKRPEWARHRVGCSMLSCSS